MDDPLPSTPASDASFEENDDFAEPKVNPEDDSVILAQPATGDKPVVLLTPSTNPPNPKASLTQEAQDFLPRVTGSLKTARPLKFCFLFLVTFI